MSADRTQVVLATYRLTAGTSTASSFVVSRPHPTQVGKPQFLLVTCAHVLEQAPGDEATLVLRARNDATGDYRRTPQQLTIRQDGKPLWAKHPAHDVAVLELPPLEDDALRAVAFNMLAAEDDWKANAVAPGDIVRCVGFPHAAQFDPSEGGLPLVRLGCLASFPLLPLQKHPTFLVDFNTFEGDSGAPLFVELAGPRPGGAQIKILGMVQGQHFIDERYELIYEKGQIRKRLGLAIVINAEAIRETINRLP
jgi:hypothetical protein